MTVSIFNQMEKIIPIALFVSKNLFLIILTAIITYFFSTRIYRKENRNHIRESIFEDLLMLEFPITYINFTKHPTNIENYNEFSKVIKNINSKIAILIISNEKKYTIIRKNLAELEELITMCKYEEIDGTNEPVPIEEKTEVEKRLREIHNKVIDVYSLLGIDTYKNILYTGKIKEVLTRIMLKKKTKSKHINL